MVAFGQVTPNIIFAFGAFQLFFLTNKDFKLHFLFFITIKHDPKFTKILIRNAHRIYRCNHLPYMYVIFALGLIASAEQRKRLVEYSLKGYRWSTDFIKYSKLVPEVKSCFGYRN